MRSHSCPRCAELEEEIAYLKGELGLHEESEAIDALAKAFKIRPAVARILLRLFAAKGRIVSKFQLEEALPIIHAGDERNPKIVDVYVCDIRKRLGAPAVLTVWGHGFRLATDAIPKVEAVIAAHRVYTAAALAARSEPAA